MTLWHRGINYGPAIAGRSGQSGASALDFSRAGPSALATALKVRANGQGAAACKCTDRNASHGIWTVMIIRRDMDVLHIFYTQAPGPSGVVACTWHCITRAGNGGYLAEATNH